MAPAAKKRKLDTNVEKFPCFSCDTLRLSKLFPDYNPSPDCDHLINTCKTCLKKWVAANVESSNFVTSGENGEIWGIKCPHPQCDAVMRNVNVEEAATKKVYAQFEELERKHIGNTTPGWRWCLAPGCRAGQVHETKAEVVVEEPKPKKRSTTKKGVEKIRAPTPAEPDICVCHECGAKACVPCDRPFHEGETCEQYKARTKGHMDEEDAALKRIQQTTKSCPNCAKRIEKNGGCKYIVALNNDRGDG